MVELSDEQADLFLELCALPAWIFDVGSRAVMGSNKAALQFYGYTEKEFLEKTAADIFPAEELANLVAELGSSRHTSSPRRRLQHRRDEAFPCAVREVLFRGRSSALVVVHAWLPTEVTDKDVLNKAAEPSERSLPDSPLPSLTAMQTPGSHALKQLAVLVLDDDCNTREMLSDVLQLYGATVQTASTAQQALRMLKDFQPGLIMSDVGMPDEDGFDFIRQLRALPSELGGQTPAIAVTGYARSEDKERALSLGYQVFVAKPLDIEDLIKNIERLCKSLL